MAMNITLAPGPIGAAVHSADLAAVADDDFVKLRDLVHERGVVAVRGQKLSEAEHVAFARRFGDLSTRYPELFFVSNVDENGKPLGSKDAGEFWHTDGAYLPSPHSVSMLYAVEVPHGDDGAPLGDTLFAGMAAAYDALQPATRELIDGLRGVHSLYHRYTINPDKPGSMATQSAAFAPVSHPLAIRHPVTGRRCLYLSEGYTTQVEGLSQDEGRQLLTMLCQHVAKPEFAYRHAWAEGDLVIWDNRATLHRATFDYAPTQRRVMRRATVGGGPLG